MKLVKIKLMLLYSKVGRYIVAIFSTMVFILILFEIAERKSIYITLFIEAISVIFGIFLEVYLFTYRHRGTIYVEKDKRKEQFKLVEYHKNDKSYFVAELEHEYVVKLQGKDYFRNYRKSEVILEENPDIETPIIEITSITKISKPADNEYAVFALKGEKLKTENQKIIVKSVTKDISLSL